MLSRSRIAYITALACLAAWRASAISVPFSEDFDAGAAGWEDAAGNPLSFEASGGAQGGGHVSTLFNYFGFSSPFGGGPVIFRANDSDDASADAFVGDWIAAGVQGVTLLVRHDAPQDLTFFLRVANSFNFPGAVIPGTQAVAPDTWTQIFFAVDPSSPLCIGETIPCADALDGVGNLQFGTDAPPALTGTDAFVTLEIDRVTVVPEPDALPLLAAGLLGLARLRRHRPLRGQAGLA